MFWSKPNYIGISISDFSVKLAKVNKKRAVENYGEKILDNSLVEEGIIKNKEKLAENLKGLLKETNVKTKRAVISLPPSRLFLHLFYFKQNLKGQELRKEVLAQAEKTIPLETDKVYWDFKKSNNPEEGINVLYVAAKKELVEDYIEVMEKADLEVMKIEPEAIALGRVLLSNQDSEKAIIDLGAKSTNLSIFGENNKLWFNGFINYGGEDLTQAIARQKGIDSKEAEQLKSQHGLNQDKKDNEVLPIIQKELQFPLKELKQTFKYYEEKRGGKVEKIILTGGAALLPYIDKYLSLNLDKEVELGSPLSNLAGDETQLSNKGTTAHLSVFSSSLGLSLGSLEKTKADETINLLPEYT